MQRPRFRVQQGHKAHRAKSRLKNIAEPTVQTGRGVNTAYADRPSLHRHMRICRIICYLTEGVHASESDHADKVAARVRMTILVMIKTLCRSVWAHAVQSSSATEDWASEQIVENLKTIGLKDERLISKADQENSTLNILLGIESVKTIQSPALQNNPAQQTCLTTGASG